MCSVQIRRISLEPTDKDAFRNRSGIIPEHKRGKPGNERGGHPEWSLSWNRHLPQPDCTKLWPRSYTWQMHTPLKVVFPFKNLLQPLLRTAGKWQYWVSMHPSSVITAILYSFYFIFPLRKTVTKFSLTSLFSKISRNFGLRSTGKINRTAVIMLLGCIY